MLPKSSDHRTIKTLFGFLVNSLARLRLINLRLPEMSVLRYSQFVSITWIQRRQTRDSLILTLSSMKMRRIFKTRKINRTYRAFPSYFRKRKKNSLTIRVHQLCTERPLLWTLYSQIILISLFSNTTLLIAPIKSLLKDSNKLLICLQDLKNFIQIFEFWVNLKQESSLK